MIYNDPALMPKRKAKDTVTVTISGSGDATYCYVLIDGVTYTSAAVVEIPASTEVYCCGYSPSNDSRCISRNGNRVGEQNQNFVFYYSFHPNCDAAIVLEYSGGLAWRRSGIVTITDAA